MPGEQQNSERRTHEEQPKGTRHKKNTRRANEEHAKSTRREQAKSTRTQTAHEQQKKNTRRPPENNARIPAEQRTERSAHEEHPKDHENHERVSSWVFLHGFGYVFGNSSSPYITQWTECTANNTEVRGSSPQGSINQAHFVTQYIARTPGFEPWTLQT